jgi:uncharacterized protein DUF4352
MARRKKLLLACAFVSACLVGGTVAAWLGASPAGASVPKPCATTGPYVKPDGKPSKNSSKSNPGKLFKGRASAEDDDQERQIGQTANLGGYTTTVLGGAFVPEINEFETDGYMKVTVKLCNRDQSAQDVSQFDWKVQSPTGTQLDSTFTTAPQLPVRSGLAQGGEATGDLYFEVGAQRGDFYVIFKPLADPFDSDRGVWKITI